VDERTVASWQRRAGSHCQKVHEHLVQQPSNLGQVQADEIRIKCQGGIVWMAMALWVSTRLWLGGAVSAFRDGNLIASLIEQVRLCALCRPLLFCIDGFVAYVSAIQNVFRTPVFTGKRGRPRLRMWDNICIVQVVKEYSAKRVVEVIRRIIQGTQKQVQLLLEKTQNTAQAHVAYIERLNGTFRSRIVALIRRGRSLMRQSETLQQAMYLVGTVYNFCASHKSLRLVLYLPDNSRRWVPRTPAIAVDGEWHHVATTYDGEVMYLYIDGELDGETATDAEPILHDDPLVIGGDDRGAGVQVKGIVDEVGLFNRALSEEDVKSIMENGLKTATAVSLAGKLTTTWGSIKEGDQASF
jgi:hypothetical protein